MSSLLEATASPYSFHHSAIYVAWQTDEIIGLELWRNLGLALGAIFLITLVILANIHLCLFVICIVIVTLTDIVGYLHFWGVTINVISSINIILSIGLCVDYSLHIAIAYMVAKGSRQDKAVSAVSSIGPAVLNGGVTTFLALLLCSLTYSQVLVTFFRVFLLTVIFGLFHGLVLLPVMLCLAGPTDSTSQETSTTSTDISSDSSATPPAVTLPPETKTSSTGEASRKASQEPNCQGL